ncbi:ABC transporter ATP-binding protein [Nocardia panacis]|uniref:ABC transporter ATP-binding protein n=1 Tax=Nocardia panacis TaxID=2340916 RepID=A0A3A4K7P0_9NOCA|nr:ABC transporter ATP-binding protein [Nocardia panacis]RJO70707.1 ABC transporter ATP-binding protein [Nocardia panacis]
MTRLLEVTGLRVRLGGRIVLDGIDIGIDAGERVGVIGASGSGKSMLALAVSGLLPAQATVSGSVRFGGVELLGADERELSAIRGRRLGMVFQEPRSALNPLMRVGKQLSEPLRLHAGLGRKAAHGAAVALAARVGLPSPETIVRAYPHQLSGGQLQRVCVAMALAARPDLLIADEPTTALDALVQNEVLGVIDDLVDDQGAALLFITHDLAVLARMARRVLVVHEGRIVEDADLLAGLTRSAQPVTRRLLQQAAATTFRRASVLPLGPDSEASR